MLAHCFWRIVKSNGRCASLKIIDNIYTARSLIDIIISHAIHTNAETRALGRRTCSLARSLDRLLGAISLLHARCDRTR